MGRLIRHWTDLIKLAVVAHQCSWRQLNNYKGLTYKPVISNVINISWGNLSRTLIIVPPAPHGMAIGRWVGRIFLVWLPSSAISLWRSQWSFPCYKVMTRINLIWFVTYITMSGFPGLSCRLPRILHRNEYTTITITIEDNSQFFHSLQMIDLI